MVNGVHLTAGASDILRRGGADNLSDDQMLLMELTKRAPGLSPEELRQCFVSCLLEYGDSALRAVREGYVQFKRRAPK